MNTKAEHNDIAGTMDHQRMAHALEDFHESPPPSRATPGQRHVLNRAMFYLVGGFVAFMALMFLAQSINPPDSALRSEEVMYLLGPYDGLWEGREWRLNLQGEVLERYDVTMEIISGSATMQTVRIRREPVTPGDSVEAEFWVNQLTPDGSVLMRTGHEQGDKGRFRGTMMDSGVLWTRENDEFTEVQRVWIGENLLHTDTIIIPKSPGAEPVMQSGQFRRTELF